MAADNGQPDSIAAAITQVSENLSNLVHDEVELAKAEVKQKGMSLLRGVGAVAAGAVFGVFAVVTGLITVGWALDAILVNGVGEIWLGFAIVTGVLILLAVVAFLAAWRGLKVGAPTPTMAIDEAKKIRDTVSSSAGKS
ncbi:MAG TPA: phage holin family protein [Solirubrobacteraceae bacterium]|nr:phage holin family protein [Solirubrobacteraceae bacterium]